MWHGRQKDLLLFQRTQFKSQDLAQSPTMTAHNHLQLKFPGIWYPLQASPSTRHTCCVQKHMWIKYSNNK